MWHSSLMGGGAGADDGAGPGTGRRSALAGPFQDGQPRLRERHAESGPAELEGRRLDADHGPAVAEGGPQLVLAHPARLGGPGLADLGLTFDAIIDRGVFHVFDDENRARYVTSLASVLRPGGHCYLICFSDRQPGTCGPRRVSQDELRAAFSHGWTVAGIEAAAFELSRPGIGIPFAQAWLAVLERTGQA